MGSVVARYEAGFSVVSHSDDWGVFRVTCEAVNFGEQSLRAGLSRPTPFGFSDDAIPYTPKDT